MPWIKLDDQFWTHPKLERLSDKAHRLYLRSIGYAAQHLTDGLLDTTALRTLGATQRLCEELCEPIYPGESGVWEPVRQGYLIHDYLDYNPSRQEVLERRRRDADRQAKRRGAANQHPATGRFTA